MACTGTVKEDDINFEDEPNTVEEEQHEVGLEHVGGEEEDRQNGAEKKQTRRKCTKEQQRRGDTPCSGTGPKKWQGRTT